MGSSALICADNQASLSTSEENVDEYDYIDELEDGYEY